MRFESHESERSTDAACLFAGIAVAMDVARDMVSEASDGNPHRLYALLDVVEAAARWGHCVCNETPRMPWEPDPSPAENHRES